MRRILIFLMVNPILLITNCLSQPTQEWIRLYPDTNTFSANGYALALDSTGNVFITGLATNNSTWRDYCTVKYSPAGVQQWVSNFRGPLSITFAKAIALDDSSNVYVTGYSNNGSTFFDFCTVKYNTNGVQQWVRFYTSSG